MRLRRGNLELKENKCFNGNIGTQISIEMNEMAVLVMVAAWINYSYHYDFIAVKRDNCR